MYLQNIAAINIFPGEIIDIFADYVCSCRLPISACIKPGSFSKDSSSGFLCEIFHIVKVCVKPCT